MQLLRASPMVPINITLFSMDETGGIGPQVLSSGAYSDSIAGVVIPHSAIAAGTYILVPSTYSSGIEIEFQVLLYTTGRGVESLWLRH